MDTIILVGSETLPDKCAVCGNSSQQRFDLWVHKEHTLKRVFFSYLIKPFFGWILAWLIEDEVFDNRPINVRLPVCASHNKKSETRKIQARALGGRRRVEIYCLHPNLINEFQEKQNEKWNFDID